MAPRNNDGPKRCRGCGREVLIIKTGTVYKNVLVDAEPVDVIQETGGDLFVTADGRAIHGYQAGDAMDDPDTECIPAFIPHKGHCPTGGRAPRNRQRRPSGYR